ncbi:hypothetical protein BD414DRAFT_483924 [Trametes punicea]|nr:hypothetical protein BD414DRAFT_483924 [Trametes punicea]
MSSALTPSGAASAPLVSHSPRSRRLVPHSIAIGTRTRSPRGSVHRPLRSPSVLTPGPAPRSVSRPPPLTFATEHHAHTPSPHSRHHDHRSYNCISQAEHSRTSYNF